MAVGWTSSTCARRKTRRTRRVISDGALGCKVSHKQAWASSQGRRTLPSLILVPRGNCGRASFQDSRKPRVLETLNFKKLLKRVIVDRA